MYEKDILITDADHRRLRSLVDWMRASGRGTHVGALATRIRRAVIVSPKEIPRNVVTLNSRVYLKDLDSRKRLEYTLSDPFDITTFGDRLSVAGPAGIALLGKRVGQIVRWALGPRERRFRIEQVAYQPEAAGDFHL
jgi:regulator of nucleoside diphosphate kinase